MREGREGARVKPGNQLVYNIDMMNVFFMFSMFSSSLWLSSTHSTSSSSCGFPRLTSSVLVVSSSSSSSEPSQ